MNLPASVLLGANSPFISGYFIKNPLRKDVGKSIIRAAFPKETRTKKNYKGQNLT
jgi:hypothetical protein